MTIYVCGLCLFLSCPRHGKSCSSSRSFTRLTIYACLIVKHTLFMRIHVLTRLAAFPLYPSLLSTETDLSIYTLSSFESTLFNMPLVLLSTQFIRSLFRHNHHEEHLAIRDPGVLPDQSSTMCVNPIDFTRRENKVMRSDSSSLQGSMQGEQQHQEQQSA